VTCAAFSPDGKLLATGSRDQTVKIWDVAGRGLVTTLNAATGAVWTVAFTPEGNSLVTSGLGSTLLWNCDSWQPLKTFPGQTASVPQAGSLLAISEANLFYWWQPPGAVSIWDYSTGEKIRELPKPGRAIAFAPDGKTLAVGDRPGDIHLWDVASGEITRTLGTAKSAWSLAFAPDGKQLLAVAGAQELLLWDLTTNAPPQKVEAHSMSTWAAIFSPDATTLATASSDQTLRLTDATTLRVKNILRGHEHEVWCVAFSPNGKMLATGGKDQKVMLWSGEARERHDSFPNRGSLRPFFSPDGSRLATAAPPEAPTATTIWNLNDGALAPHHSGPADRGFFRRWHPADPLGHGRPGH
jgi:WD40 repeat protein